jgi:hypothetical protein
LFQDYSGVVWCGTISGERVFFVPDNGIGFEQDKAGDRLNPLPASIEHRQAKDSVSDWPL